MVHILFGDKRPTELLLHDEPVLEDVPSLGCSRFALANEDQDVTRSVDLLGMLVIFPAALSGAEELSLPSAYVASYESPACSAEPSFLRVWVALVVSSGDELGSVRGRPIALAGAERVLAFLPLSPDHFCTTVLALEMQKRPASVG